MLTRPWTPARSWPTLFAVLLFGFAVACGGSSSRTSTGSPDSTALVRISIVPLNSQLYQGGTFTFVATVTGTTNSSVTWSVQEGPAGGTITSAGLYTAPKAAGIFHVVATSSADPAKSATTSVTVSTVEVALSPFNVDMGSSESIKFKADVTGTVDPSVTWTVQEGPSGGTITNLGDYTAPAANGTYHVVATSQWDTTKSSTAVVSVNPLAVTLSPATDLLGPAGARTVFATVSGSVNTSVTWSVAEGSAGGSISQSGDYTAPNGTGTFHVVAASQKQPSVTASATFTIVGSGFRPTGTMAANRTGPTATLLSNGKVLVTGGDACFYFSYYGTGICNQASAELYDPASGAFTPTGSMLRPRSFHTATLLQNGKVLIAGGVGALNSAELYDPSTGTFSATGNLNATRAHHVAVPLPNGNVLLAGGDLVVTGEEYVPSTGTFANKGTMAVARSAPTATLLGNGKVLVVGGLNGQFPTSSAELYDPATGNFSPTGGLATARVRHSACLLPDGNVLITGGSPDNYKSTASTEVYQVSSGFFSAPGTMVFAHDSHVAMVLQNGTILAAGGLSTFTPNHTAESYNPLTGTFTQIGGLYRERAFAAAAMMQDGSVLVVGGSDLASAEIFK